MSDPTALVAELDREVEREAERIAESVLRRAPIFLEKVAGDFYEMMLREVQTYLRENAAFNIQSELSSLRASLQAERERSAQQAATIEAVTKEASGLAAALWRGHYLEAAPDWRPFDDPVGLLTQIDNMTAGLREKLQVERARATAAEAERDRLREALEAAKGWLEGWASAERELAVIDAALSIAKDRGE